MYSIINLFFLYFATISEITMAQEGSNEEDALSSSEEYLTNQPKFSLRSSDFADIVTTAAFVDKSSFIKTFIEDQEIVVITAPNHFGKSTNMDMIKRFLEIEVDEDGNRKTKSSHFRQPVRDTDNYRLFVDNRLEITKNESFMDCHFGKHPVLHVDMEFNSMNVMSYDVAVEQMKYIVHCSYVDHQYLKRSNKLNHEEKAKIKQWCSTNGYSKIPDGDLDDSLRLLSRYLSRHYDNRPVYVLIDNFDSPALNAIFFAHSEGIMGGIYRLESSIILKVLQKNIHVYKGLISGMSYVAGSPTLYSLGYIQVCRFLEDHSYSGFHGLTQTEATQLFSSERFSLSSEMIHAAEINYGGYKSLCGNVSLYNPWSINHMLLFQEVRDYWDGPGILINIANLLRVPALKSEVSLLTEGRDRKVKSKKIYAPDDVIRLRDLVHKPQFHKELHYADMVLSLLLELGYLSYVPTGQSFTSRHLARLPNKEMRRRVLEAIHKYKKLYGPADQAEEPHKKQFQYRTWEIN